MNKHPKKEGLKGQPMPEATSSITESEIDATAVLEQLVDAWEHGHWDDTGAKVINQYRRKIGRLPRVAADG